MREMNMGNSSIKYTQCPNCGKQMVKDNVMGKTLVYADRLRCFKCGYWETRALLDPRQREKEDYGIELELE